MAINTVKKTNNSYLKDLILLFAVPVVIAIFAAAVVYIPRAMAKPKYDFIYSICEDYRCKDDYSVDAAGLITRNYPNSYDLNDLGYYNRSASLRYYDTSKDSTRSLTLEEAQRYRLDTASKSSDGYSLSKDNTSSGFLFWGDYNEGWYLKNGAKKKKLELSNGGSNYPGDIKFLGWINK